MLHITFSCTFFLFIQSSFSLLNIYSLLFFLSFHETFSYVLVFSFSVNISRIFSKNTISSSDLVLDF